jgi:hypothetical protein
MATKKVPDNWIPCPKSKTAPQDYVYWSKPYLETNNELMYVDPYKAKQAIRAGRFSRVGEPALNCIDDDPMNDTTQYSGTAAMRERRNNFISKMVYDQGKDSRSHRRRQIAGKSESGWAIYLAQMGIPPVVARELGIDSMEDLNAIPLGSPHPNNKKKAAKKFPRVYWCGTSKRAARVSGYHLRGYRTAALYAKIFGKLPDLEKGVAPPRNYKKS